MLTISLPWVSPPILASWRDKAQSWRCAATSMIPLSGLHGVHMIEAVSLPMYLGWMGMLPSAPSPDALPADLLPPGGDETNEGYSGVFPSVDAHFREIKLTHKWVWLASTPGGRPHSMSRRLAHTLKGVGLRPTLARKIPHSQNRFAPPFSLMDLREPSIALLHLVAPPAYPDLHTPRPKILKIRSRL